EEEHVHAEAQEADEQGEDADDEERPAAVDPLLVVDVEGVRLEGERRPEEQREAGAAHPDRPACHVQALGRIEMSTFGTDRSAEPSGSSNRSAGVNPKFIAMMFVGNTCCAVLKRVT